jgi:hypothetical protein
MAIARPIRLLGAVTILAVLLVLYKMSYSPVSTVPLAPGVDTNKITDGMKRDPLLDRECYRDKRRAKGEDANLLRSNRRT